MHSIQVRPAAARYASLLYVLVATLGLVGCDDSAPPEQDPVDQGSGSGSSPVDGSGQAGQGGLGGSGLQGNAAQEGGGAQTASSGSQNTSDVGADFGVQNDPSIGTGSGGIGSSDGQATGGTDAPGPTEDPGAPPSTPAGPADGDPSRPVVSLPDVRCGPATGLLDGLVGNNFIGLPPPGDTNVKIGGRDVILSYPCNKHEGAHVTFILNLHGTMPLEELKLYQHSYFAAHKLATSHNLIVVSPKSVVSQWTNGDNGRDLPHLYEVIDWVYEKFAKFQITGLWIGGHSWGSAFAKRFVCDDMLQDKVRGVIGMSGGATGVGNGGFFGGGGGTCAARISQIHTVGDADIPGVPDQSAAATAHGCQGKTPPTDIGNGQMVEEWPNCDPGWVHLNITMGAHDHVTPINQEVVKLVVDKIKSTERR